MIDAKKVMNYEDACKLLGREPLTLAHFDFLPEGERLAMFSLHKIRTAIEALNEGHVFDWDNYREYRYYPWFDMRTPDDAPAGSGFSFGGYGYGHSYADVGARLCLRSSEHAEHIGKTFLADYRNWMKQ